MVRRSNEQQAYFDVSLPFVRLVGYLVVCSLCYYRCMPYLGAVACPCGFLARVSRKRLFAMLIIYHDLCTCLLHLFCKKSISSAMLMPILVVLSVGESDGIVLAFVIAIEFPFRQYSSKWV